MSYTFVVVSTRKAAVSVSHGHPFAPGSHLLKWLLGPWEAGQIHASDHMMHHIIRSEISQWCIGLWWHHRCHLISMYNDINLPKVQGISNDCRGSLLFIGSVIQEISLAWTDVITLDSMFWDSNTTNLDICVNNNQLFGHIFSYRTSSLALGCNYLSVYMIMATAGGQGDGNSRTGWQKYVYAYGPYMALVKQRYLGSNASNTNVITS